MSDPKIADVATIRGEVEKLFGIRWDTLLQWTVISWLSIWWWTTRTAIDPIGWNGGPLTAVENFLISLDVIPPAWFSDALDWLLAPSRRWLAGVLVAVAVVTCVAAVRSPTLSGLRTVALLCTGTVCEMERSFVPVSWILGWALVPAVIASAIAHFDGHRDRGWSTQYEYYSIGQIFQAYIARILFLFIVPVLAPLLLLMQLAAGFRTSVPYEPAQELNVEVMRAIEHLGDNRSSKLDPLTEMSARAAIYLAGNPSDDAHQIASDFRFAMKERRGREH